MRCTGGAAAPSGSTFRWCVFAVTSSLKTLMHLLVRIVVDEGAPGALPGEPGVEARGDEAVGPLLALRGALRERVGVFVLGVTGVAAHPAPLNGVARRGLHELAPQLQVLDGAAFPLPAPRLPVFYPLRHSLYQVFGVGHIHDLGLPPLPAPPFEGAARAGERHLLVRGVGGALE